MIGFAIEIIDSAEGFVEFKKNTMLSIHLKFAEASYVLIFQRIQNHLTNQV